MKRSIKIFFIIIFIILLSIGANSEIRKIITPQPSHQTNSVEQNNTTPTQNATNNEQNKTPQETTPAKIQTPPETNPAENTNTAPITPADTTLRLGAAGENVKELQRKLNKFNYNLSVDGNFGTSTNFAVKDFQKKVGLAADGIVGPSTLNKIDSTPSRAPYLYNPTLVYENLVNSSNFPSRTGYFIYVSLSKHKVCILKGSNQNWEAFKLFSCSVGKPSTPTITGRFTLGAKGSYFIAESGLICKYYSQITGDFLFHSILYYPSGGVADSRLGYSISHGCIRLATDNAYYIYSSIPSGTAVWIQN
jgi:peptidoglycan hydrolase-like protein with peptidoglycan-binding domain